MWEMQWISESAEGWGQPYAQCVLLLFISFPRFEFLKLEACFEDLTHKVTKREPYPHIHVLKSSQKARTDRSYTLLLFKNETS